MTAIDGYEAGREKKEAKGSNVASRVILLFMYYYASISLLRGVERNPDFSRYTSNTPCKIGFLIYIMHGYCYPTIFCLVNARKHIRCVGLFDFLFLKGDAEVRAQLKETRRKKI